MPNKRNRPSRTSLPTTLQRKTGRKRRQHRRHFGAKHRSSGCRNTFGHFHRKAPMNFRFKAISGFNYTKRRLGPFSRIGSFRTWQYTPSIGKLIDDWKLRMRRQRIAAGGNRRSRFAVVVQSRECGDIKHMKDGLYPVPPPTRLSADPVCIICGLSPAASALSQLSLLKNHETMVSSHGRFQSADRLRYVRQISRGMLQGPLSEIREWKQNWRRRGKSPNSSFLKALMNWWPRLLLHLEFRVLRRT